MYVLRKPLGRLMVLGCCAGLITFSGAQTVEAQGRPGNAAAPVSASEALRRAQASTGVAYTEAVYQFVTALQRERPTSYWKQPIELGGYKITFAQPKGDASLWDPTYFDFYAPSGWVQLERLRTRVVTNGPGVSFVGIRQATPERMAANAYLSEVGMACSVTALIEFTAPSRSGAPVNVVIKMVNPKRSSKAVAADYSAPLELLLVQTRSDSFVRQGLLKPLESSNITGLYMLEPYQKDKIPVVLVHGLDSSPRTWVDVYNELMLDPNLRNRYQFWVFRYPTGNPVVLSATFLRETLQSVRERNDPEHNDKSFDNMVVIGHSMGGVLARLLVTEPGDAFWRANSSVPFEQANLSADDRNALKHTLFFKRQAYVKRVVFISTPHRGSDLANSALGNLANRLVAMPIEIAGVDEGTRRDNLKVATSIDNLKPSSRFVQTLQSQAIYAPYHSIIGNQGVTVRGVPDSDGVVPYESSHLEGAQSELVVPSDHSAHMHPLAVREIARILQLHLSSR